MKTISVIMLCLVVNVACYSQQRQNELTSTS